MCPFNNNQCTPGLVHSLVPGLVPGLVRGCGAKDEQRKAHSLNTGWINRKNTDSYKLKCPNKSARAKKKRQAPAIR